jgi:hypothetical protein
MSFQLLVYYWLLILCVLSVILLFFPSERFRAGLGRLLSKLWSFSSPVGWLFSIMVLGLFAAAVINQHNASRLYPKISLARDLNEKVCYRFTRRWGGVGWTWTSVSVCVCVHVLSV